LASITASILEQEAASEPAAAPAGAAALAELAGLDALVAALEEADESVIVVDELPHAASEIPRAARAMGVTNPAGSGFDMYECSDRLERVVQHNAAVGTLPPGAAEVGQDRPRGQTDRLA
jgi:hypothetical protein